MLTNTISTVLISATLLFSTARSAPTSVRRDTLTGSTRQGQACATVHVADSLWGGACGYDQLGKPHGNLPAVAIPADIFYPNSPQSNGNLNSLCSKTATITGQSGQSVKAIIVSCNVPNPTQDCGVGNPSSFDMSPELWAEFGGAAWTPNAGTPSYLQKITFSID